MAADTGCSRTLVHASLVPTHRRLREHVEVCCAHGDVTLQPMAEVDIELDGESFPMVVGVAETLPRSVLLGLDFPELPLLLATRLQEGGEEALLVMTRERKRREKAEAIRLASHMTATSKPLVNLSPDGELPTAAGTQCSSSRVEQKRSGEEVADGRDAELAGESGKTRCRQNSKTLPNPRNRAVEGIVRAAEGSPEKRCDVAGGVHSVGQTETDIRGRK